MQTDDRAHVTEEFYKRFPKQKQGRVKKGILKLLHRAKIIDRTLLLRATEPLPRDDLGKFFEELGAIHGAVATARPDVDLVTIEDTAGTGQRITIPLRLIIEYAEGKIGMDEYIGHWKIEGGRRGR